MTLAKAKVVLVGAAHTGKTAIINRFVYGDFTPHTRPNTQPALFRKKMYHVGQALTLEIWDTAGQEQYHALSPMFYRDADAGIVVCDVTDVSSFEKCRQWVNELRQARGEQIVIAVAGNKSDLASQRKVTLEQISSFASGFASTSFETSAKTGENIELLFSGIITELARRASTAALAPPDPSRGNKRLKKQGSVRFDQPQPEKPSSCC
jgi:small GTP-binding protein